MSIMKIVFFNFTINYGGGPQYAVHLAQLLSAHHEVHIVEAYGCCLPFVEAVQELDVKFHVLCPDEENHYIGDKGIRRYLRALRQLPNFLDLIKRLRQILADIGPDVAWVTNEKSLTFLHFSSSRNTLPLLMFEIGWSKAETVSRWLRYLWKRKVAGVVAVSSATLNELKKAGVPDSKLYLGSMTVGFDEVIELSKEPFDKPIEYKTFYPKILHLAARPTYAKGHHLAYKAIADLKQKGYLPALWITGTMPTGVTNEYILELEELAHKLDISENIFFLGWQPNFPAVFKACDIGILPSYTEGFPRVILEAMLLKKPIIATPVGGVEDSIKHEKTGLIVPVGDAIALSEEIQILLQNPVLKEQIIQNAWEMVHLNYSPQKHLENIERIIMESVKSIGSID